MTQKQRFLAAVRRQTPDVVPVAPLIHLRYAHQLYGRADWRTVFDAHRLIGSCHHRGPLGVGVSCTMPDGYSSETRELERRPDGRVTSEWVIRTPKRTMRGQVLKGMIPHDPLVSKTVDYPVKDTDDWRAWLDYRQTWLDHARGPWVGQLDEVVATMGEDGMPSVGLGPAYTNLGSVRGMEGLMVDLYDHPDLMDELFAVERRITQEHVKAFVAAPTEVAWLDICWATGSVLGPKVFERWALGDVVAAMEVIRDAPGKILGLYTLGRIGKLLPMLVDTGVHFIETFEQNEGDITLAEAKRLYGDRICVMGNFDPLVLSFGTVEDARQEALRCLREGMPGGGYVMVTGDEVPADTKLDNLKAMVETVEQHGRY